MGKQDCLVPNEQQVVNYYRLLINSKHNKLNPYSEAVK